MQIEPLRLAGTCLITPKRFRDTRGYFTETYRTEIFAKHGLVTDWVQENQSLSQRGVLRGLHFQLPPHSETKLIRVVRGAILDVFVDLRKDSPTFCQWDAVELNDENLRMAYIPKGFAHGFCALSEWVVVTYKVDSYYAPGAVAGLRWDDPAFNIDWPMEAPLLSEKDAALPFLEDFPSPF